MNQFLTETPLKDTTPLSTTHVITEDVVERPTKVSPEVTEETTEQFFPPEVSPTEETPTEISVVTTEGSPLKTEGIPLTTTTEEPSTESRIVTRDVTRQLTPSSETTSVTSLTANTTSVNSTSSEVTANVLNVTQESANETDFCLTSQFLCPKECHCIFSDQKCYGRVDCLLDVFDQSFSILRFLSEALTCCAAKEGFLCDNSERQEM